MSGAELINANSCVETPAAPDWLMKLENRREQLSRSKLGHEVGAGAPCNVCGGNCPGLDLHFWRKVCRNCKCRKDQHKCAEDNLGWAQFEVLGQIRSKSAYIKIKALASQPIQVEWVPPNAAPDVVSDYMEKLGTTKIPVVGSDAADKRKQQLEFQVPPHDLDASLCDNLSEKEKNHLTQYVEKIRENCVGQGSVVRIGAKSFGVMGHMAKEILLPDWWAYMSEVPENDHVLGDLLSSEKLSKAIASEIKAPYLKLWVAFTEPISVQSAAEFELKPLLSETKAKLCGLNTKAVHSLLRNGLIYDKILSILRKNNLDISRDPKLGPIADFRKEYKNNPQFRKEIDTNFLENIDNSNQHGKLSQTGDTSLPFNSPLPLKNELHARYGLQIRQETPLRKVKFGDVSIIQECGLPFNVQYEKDPVFADILNSEPLKNAFENINKGYALEPVVISLKPLSPDFMNDLILSAKTKQRLKALKIDVNCLQSVVLNGAFYDQIFQMLDSKDIPYNGCNLLVPLKQVRQELLQNAPLCEEVNKFVIQMPRSAAISYGNAQSYLSGSLKGSRSNDSGFDSKPLTPNHGDEINATTGKFFSIPGIEELNMYPACESTGATAVASILQNLNLSTGRESEEVTGPTLRCRDCQQFINFGEVAVKAERAGKEVAWHPECFKCHTCCELLADLVYFFYGGEVYCGRDLAVKLKIPRCKACDELIFTKEYTAAEDATFHIKHFCCFHCDTPLAGQQYIPDENSNMPLCLQCYHEFFAAACQRCGRAIGPADQGVAWKDTHWHSSCFICADPNCSKSLIGGRFCVKQNMPFCSPACVNSVLK